jgi:menaquinol-cytochrome c reductase iron-sulfur subunit
MNRKSDDGGAPRAPSFEREEAERADDPGRRRFLSRIALATGALAAAVVAMPVVGFILGPVFRRRPTEWRSVGAADEFRRGETVKVAFEDAGGRAWAGPTGRTAAWLRRDETGEFTAFALDCTHLGCPVRWEAGARLFLCPCHGGVYYADGKVAAGPPPRGLSHYQVRLRGGQVEIRTGPIPIT